MDDYNRACREYAAGSGRSRTANPTGLNARLRDHVGRLGRSIRSSGQDLRRQFGTASKGYMKEREADLLNAFDQLAAAIDRDERALFHL